MEFFRRTGAHRNTMPKLQHWCDQTAVASWEMQTKEFPGWKEGRRRLVEQGRLSRVLHPSPEHAQGHIVVD